MVPASATTVLAVPDRPGLERPEAKDQDPSDGQFAGLMALFTQTPLHREVPPARPAETPASEAADSPARTQEAASTRKVPSSDQGAKKPESSQDAKKPESSQGAAPADPAKASASKTPPSETPTPTASKVSDQALFPAVPALAVGQKAASAALVPPAPGETPQVKAPASPAPNDLAPPVLEILTDPAPAPAKASAALALALPQPPSGTGDGKPAASAQSSTTEPAAPALEPAALKSLAPKGSELAIGTHPTPTPSPSQPETHAKGPVPGAQPAPSGAEGPQVPAPGPAKVEVAAGGPDLLALKAPGLVPTPSIQVEAPQGATLAVSTLPHPAPSPVATPVQAPAAASPSTPVATVAQVEGSLRWMLKSGAQEARLQLHPESLGQVTIHLKVEGGEVHARLWVTEPASVQAVQEGRPHLEQSLKEQGLQLGSFDLQQGHRPFQEAPAAPVPRSLSPDPLLQARQETPAAPAPSILNAHRVELYA